MKMMNKEKMQALKEEDLLRAKMKQAYKVRRTHDALDTVHVHTHTSTLWGSRLNALFCFCFHTRTHTKQSGDMATVKQIEYKLMTEEEREKAKYK